MIDATDRIAVIGATKDRQKYGSVILEFLLERGYDAIPVNPKEENIQGIRCYGAISDIPGTIDIVNIIIPPERALSILDDCSKKQIKTVWLQPGSESDEARVKCKKLELNCIMGKCIMEEINRLNDGN